MTAPVEPQLAWPLTADELAAYWKVEPHFVYQEVRLGRLEVTRIGRLFRFHRAQVEAYEAERRYRAAVPVPTRAEVIGIRARRGAA